MHAVLKEKKALSSGLNLLLSIDTGGTHGLRKDGSGTSIDKEAHLFNSCFAPNPSHRNPSCPRVVLSSELN
jgi:hypothetical protein